MEQQFVQYHHNLPKKTISFGRNKLSRQALITGTQRSQFEMYEFHYLIHDDNKASSESDASKNYFHGFAKSKDKITMPVVMFAPWARLDPLYGLPQKSACIFTMTLDCSYRLLLSKTFFSWIPIGIPQFEYIPKP